jgi:predicted PurR-regulated permease PerM
LKSNINIWRILGFAAVVLFLFLFYNIAVYIAISLVLFLLGYPITYRLEKLKIGKKYIPGGLASLLTLLIILGILTALFLLIVPPLVSEFRFLSGLNFYDVLHNLLEQFPWIKSMFLSLGDEEDLKRNVSSQLSAFINADNVSVFLNNVFGYFGSVFTGILCVIFISFFLLKDEHIVTDSVLLITPTENERAMKGILKTSKIMLSRYFTGLFLDMLIVGVLVLVTLSILGIKNALVIAFCAALLNVIPYIGPAITMVIALTLGVSSCISSGAYWLIMPTISKIFFGLLSINLVDGFILQPYIFSNSVRAHPLEVFIVTLMAASLGGIAGMVVALPAYTLIRIIAREFLTHLRFFKRITDTI